MDDAWVQTFQVERTAHEALDAAQLYLEGAGMVTPSLQGVVDRRGDALVVHHGRMETKVEAVPSGDATDVTVTRSGQGPLEETRRWFYGAGLAGFLIAWLLAVYNENAATAFNPLVTIGVFFVGIFSMMVVLYVADRSMERRSESLVGSLEEAVRGDSMEILRREVDSLERVTAYVNGGLFYFGALIVEFFLHIILLSEGVRDGIDSALTIEVMRWGFTLPVLPAILFGGAYFVMSNRMHASRFHDVERKLKSLGAHTT